jgi:RNA polymerase sigma-70 factor (ECF subfamily)
MSSLDRTVSRSEENSSSLVDALGGDDRGPAADVESAEQHEALRRAVNALPEPLRQVVVLVYFQGLKYREAAQVLALPVGTVKSRMHVAMQKLTDSLAYIDLT